MHERTMPTYINQVTKKKKLRTSLATVSADINSKENDYVLNLIFVSMSGGWWIAQLANNVRTSGDGKSSYDELFLLAVQVHGLGRDSWVYCAHVYRCIPWSFLQFKELVNVVRL